MKIRGKRRANRHIKSPSIVSTLSEPSCFYGVVLVYLPHPSSSHSGYSLVTFCSMKKGGKYIQHPFSSKSSNVSTCYQLRHTFFPIASIIYEFCRNMVYYYKSTQ